MAFPHPPADVDAIRRHYDSISFLYRAFWGEHIHHGYWMGEESPEQAQVQLIEQLARQARIAPNARVLDVGCGFGGSSRWLARNLDCCVLGITISPVQAAAAVNLTWQEALASHCSFRTMDAGNLRLPAAAFDVVWVIECSEHLADKGAFIADAARVLRPGGVLALCAWLAAEPPRPAEHDSLLEEVCAAMLCPSLATMAQYTAWMAEAGFESVEARDITPSVQRTWDHCAAVLARPYVRAALHLLDRSTHRFVQSFPVMQRAYAERAMRYGMFAAWKASKPT